ncbi:17-beta-hydroxysteroid dehydrogenase type 2 [Sinocyclocheilus rhinocerous]|uniref:17-beta-hydroxysteroid dehydrogenase type 2 n=1 Tax=Sinocyclocheilus rhinocerous TaxID=307959 RepID=UPI0007B91558|nr:PREDICTED: estradiol 17-beta-dehydrogenase 2-like [Sinocyclocheilus rhinocerous]
MEGIVEGCLGFLYDLLVVICVGLLLLRVAEGRSVRWLVLLMVSGVMLSCLVHSSALKVGLVSVLCSLIHYVGREEVMLPTKNKAVLITGCDSGFGHDLAKFLDSAGMRVFAGVLDELHPGALKLKKDASPNLTVLQLDITNSSQITQAHQYIQSQTGKTGLWALVNNAGVLGYVCDGEILPIKMYKKCLDVNFIGSVEITQAFLPLIRQSKGRLISISSMAGEVPLPGFAGYGASKAALISFNGAIRQELSRWGVKVIIIQPGAFKTNILGSREQWNSAQEDILSGLAQEVMASYGEEYIRSMQQRLVNMSSVSSSDTGPFLEALKHAILSPRPKPFYYPGASAWALPLLYRHSPTSLSDRIFSRIFMSSDAQPAELLNS